MQAQELSFYISVHLSPLAKLPCVFWTAPCKDVIIEMHDPAWFVLGRDVWKRKSLLLLSLQVSILVHYVLVLTKVEGNKTRVSWYSRDRGEKLLESRRKFNLEGNKNLRAYTKVRKLLSRQLGPQHLITCEASEVILPPGKRQGKVTRIHIWSTDINKQGIISPIFSSGHGLVSTARLTVSKWESWDGWSRIESVMSKVRRWRRKSGSWVLTERQARGLAVNIGFEGPSSTTQK